MVAATDGRRHALYHANFSEPGKGFESGVNTNMASRLQSEEARQEMVIGMETKNITDVKFGLGKLLISPGAMRKLSPMEVLDALGRHSRGDWGEVCEEDRKENEFSLREGFRLLSSYQASNETKFWIITERDRSVTTVLLPQEY